ncbi:flagellar biosynthesis protein FlhA [Limnobacter humi]|uniref:Flagellar biosynthesis protein FlhA n=1 Tax=Limnobacter humi TaxID=1778671 RepID=A0ABT1WL54_9BURK|nr:flagellar biosynthesis protein FlhA [Limnobacter humi]MCQ8897519.1 flagellar biosynthesis protein FlhA [Limnobacter humi]
MSVPQATLNDVLKNAVDLNKARALAAPVFILLVLAMMVLPLPAMALDVLFTFNIALSMVVLVAALYTKKPLDFSSFPTVLLITTLLRLSLNVASTRVVLLHGHEGTDSAGKVIEAFGHFLIGGNLAVGIIVFVILMVINFVVITKGAGRIAEVSARFTLDAMPGKQMAIDADLNAGLITEAEAKKRRQETAQESEFYGSMDGASKFVRGDAVAGVFILIINIVGGLAVGMLQYDLGFASAGQKYVLLAIGDGLVAQVPALLISVAAGLVVARVGQGQDIGTQVASQLAQSPQVFAMCAGVLLLLGFIPGMPNLPFLMFGAGMAGLAYWLQKRSMAPVEDNTEQAVSRAMKEVADASWDDIKPVEPLALEIGYRLIPLVDKGPDSDLLKRIKAIRKKFTQEMGFLPPPIHVRDNLDLPPNSYRLLIKGVNMAQADVEPGAWLAIDPGEVVLRLPGPQTVDPTFGMPAYWIEQDMTERAQAGGYTVVDAATVIATHVSHLLSNHASKLIGRVECQQLLEHFGKLYPKVADELIPKMLSLSAFQKVLHNLLDDRVSIRDMRTILETLLEHAPKTQNPVELTGLVRIALSSSIVQGLAAPDRDLQVLVFDPKLENMIIQSNQGQAPADVAIEPNLANTMSNKLTHEAQRLLAMGQSPVLLVQDFLRPALAQLLRKAAPGLTILSHSEVPEYKKVSVLSVIK